MPVLVFRKIQTVANAAALLFGLCALLSGIALITSRWV
jgi:hypothetical protein